MSYNIHPQCTNSSHLKLFFLSVPFLAFLVDTLANERYRADEWLILVQHVDDQIDRVSERGKDHNSRITVEVTPFGPISLSIEPFLSKVFNEQRAKLLHLRMWRELATGCLHLVELGDDSLKLGVLRETVSLCLRRRLLAS